MSKRNKKGNLHTFFLCKPPYDSVFVAMSHGDPLVGTVEPTEDDFREITSQYPNIDKELLNDIRNTKWMFNSNDKSFILTEEAAKKADEGG